MKKIFFLWFLAITSILIAIDPDKTFVNYIVQEWETDGGLPGNSVIALRQTANGYLWIGTQDGLARFDGVIWVGTEGGFYPGKTFDITVTKHRR